MENLENLPNELLIRGGRAEDISVLIGENGSGKSTLLNALSKHFIRTGNHVIALANSIHDKFDSNHRNFKTLRGRSGRRQSRNILKKALEVSAKGDITQNLKNISRVLTYVKFAPIIGFKAEGLSNFFFEKIQELDLNQKKKEQIIYLLERLNQENQDEIIWIQLEDYSFHDFQKSVLIELFTYESLLKKNKIINRVEVYLQKNGKEISMLNASSGELALITSIIYLSTIINENTVILIDEPENSLHPKWQKEYVQTLFDIFYYYQPKIIIATHSPLVVNGAELFTKDPQIYKSQNFTLELQKKEPLNLEETYFRFFNISTPQNRFLSEQVIRLLNILTAKKITLNNFNAEIDRITTTVYDPQQIDALISIKGLATIISEKTNN
ncbi:ATP-binding protein [Fluviicola sp. SGL-29]|nr:ATP-binding protein [Fluviicola sp. SGL-29]